MSDRKEKFTPGPWRVHLDKRNGTVCSIIEDKYGDCVANTFPRYPRGERNANGYLIAAAPEIYDILKRIVEMQKRNYGNGMNTHIELHELAKEAEQILKKARSE